MLYSIHREEAIVSGVILVCADLKHACFAKKCTYRARDLGGQPGHRFSVASLPLAGGGLQRIDSGAIESSVVS